MASTQVIVVGGGAAGFFAAITCAETSPETRVILIEKGGRFLDKVRISGGGRCNVTNACMDPRHFAAHYPRGSKALLPLLQRFSAADTVAWFNARGVRLKTESDGRMFPTTDASQTILDCLTHAARLAGVHLRSHCEVASAVKRADGRFELALTATNPMPAGSGHNLPQPGVAAAGNGTAQLLVCDRLLLATGGCRSAAAGRVAVELGHTLEPPVPSLFTFQIATPWLRSLAGITVETVELWVPGERLRERGPLLVTHWGVSGPGVLRLSAWGARTLHRRNYRFPLRVNWLPGWTDEQLSTELHARRQTGPGKLVVNGPLAPLPARLWEQLVLAAGVPRGTRWAALTRAHVHALTQQLARTEFTVSGKSLNKEEFVTCGGVRLAEVDFRNLASRVCPGLFFAGELLDIDGLTGGFNFQAAWTTGWIAGQALAQ